LGCILKLKMTSITYVTVIEEKYFTYNENILSREVFIHDQTL
jgi:hypothetical protein